MLNQPNPQDFDSDRFGDAMYQKDLAAHLEDKYKERPYHEENNWWYQTAQFASYIFQFINVASGFAKPFAYMSGIFAFGAVGGILAALVAGFFVVGVEYAARKNLIQLLEKKYFKKRVNGARVLVQLVLNGAIIALSYWGATDAVKIMSGDFVATEVQLESEEQIKTHYGLLITSAQKDADAFFAASNWRGKLSPANQRRYNNLLAEKSKREAEMNQAIREAADRNRSKQDEVKAADQLALMEKEETDMKNGEVLALIAVVSCLLFTVCIWLKEFYEYRTAMELVRMGAIKNARFAQMLADAEKTISDDELRRQFAQQASNGISNHATTPPQQKQTIGFNWPGYGQAKPSPTDTLTPQPLFHSETVAQSENAVAQPPQPQQGNYADSVLELCRQNVQKEMSNFKNAQALKASVSRRICEHLDIAYTAMNGDAFSPSYEIGLKFYAYLQGTVFPTLNGVGHPYVREKLFIPLLYKRFAAQQPA